MNCFEHLWKSMSCTPCLGHLLQHCFLTDSWNGLSTLPETNIFVPENGWLEYDPFLLEWPIFRCYVSFMESNIHRSQIVWHEPKRVMLEFLDKMSSLKSSIYHSINGTWKNQSTSFTPIDTKNTNISKFVKFAPGLTRSHRNTSSL